MCYDTTMYKICICQKHNRFETRVFVPKGAKCVDLGQVILKLTTIFVRNRKFVWLFVCFVYIKTVECTQFWSVFRLYLSKVLV